ncbi:MAG: L-fucose mutarotase [Lentisphaeria bacterium]|nr:L-fucose mutarotase [Lentisphaeria bacterium]
MLKGLSPLLSPDLLKILCAMGHGDTIVLSDAHFPSHTLGPQVLRMDGIAIPELLNAIMPVWELDSYVEHPFRMMQAVPGDTLDMDYVRLCSSIVGREPGYIERFAFYEEARKAYAIIHTGETRKYGNILLQKGVIPC